MAIWRGIVVVACGLLLAACLPVVSKTPVGTTVGLGADKALYGTWKGHNPDDATAKDRFVHFMAAKDGGMTAALVMADGGDDDGWTIFRVRTTLLGKNHILNAVATFDKESAVEGSLKDANIPLLYVVRGKTLTLYLLYEDKLKAAIKAGALKGTIETGENGDAVITEEAEALDAFFAKPEAAGLFKVMLGARRVE